MNPVTRGSAKETALSIPEILSIIFSKLPPETQATCACVCKKWSEVALNELWRNLEDIHPLLKLVIDDDSFYAEGMMDEGILRHIRDADWPRFRKYAIRAGSIKFDPYQTEMSPPSGEGIAFLCLHHRFGTCFTPNVRKIQWKMASEHYATLMVPFISETLEELKIEIGDVGSESWSAAEMFHPLVHRTSTLKKLFIESSELPLDVSESFCLWIQTCVGLEEVRIPRQWHTSTIVAAFGSLPKLIEFGHQWINPPDYGEGGGISIAIGGDCFRSLRRLGWSGNIKRAEDLLRQTSRQLQGLTFDCRGQSSQGEVMAFFTTAVDCCPELDSLCLNLADVSDAVDPDGEKAPLNPNVFRPLLACNTLRKLRIHYSYSCIVSIPDVEKMGGAWPKMTELVLCPDPDVSYAMDETQGTAISTLPHIAAAFPRLRVLGLHFDFSEPPGSAGDLLPENQFRCLEELDVGTSPVPSWGPVPVGLYLASLCNVGTRLSIWAYMSDVRSRYVFGCESSSFHDWEMVETLTHETMRIKEAVVRRLSSR